MSKVWDHPSVQDRTTLLVMLALADFANDEGWCWPSMATIAKRSRSSERQVRRILEKLNAIVLPDGSRLVEIQENRGRKGGSTYHTNRYKLNLTSCPVSFGLIPVIGDSENLTSEPVNLTPAPLKPDTAMSDEPSRTTTKKQPPVEPSKSSAKAFNSTEMARILAMELGLNGKELMVLCQDAIETGTRKWGVDAEASEQRIMARWNDYQESGVEFKSGILKFLKLSKFAETNEEWGNGNAQPSAAKQTAAERYSAAVALRRANAPNGRELEKP
jgi:hypothetical protein